MKIVLYNKTRILEVFENVEKPAVDASSINWENGSVDGTDSFLLLDDAVEVGDTVTEELKAQDKGASFPKIDLRKENELLKQELAQTNADLMGLMDYVFGGSN